MSVWEGMRPFYALDIQRRTRCREEGAVGNMKKSLKKLFACLWLVCVRALPLCIVDEAFAGDDIAEIQAALAREAQAKPRLIAASPKLLSATDEVNAYWATGELNVEKAFGETISLQFNIPQNYTHISSARLTINAYDVDTKFGRERDEVYFNGTHLGRLYGGADCWNENEFSVPTSLIKSGINHLYIVADADKENWWVTIGWAKLVIDSVVDYIKLEASQNYDDRIQLEWKDVSSGLSGARYYVDRRGNPNDQFKCLNPDDPTCVRQYKDMDKDCLPGVNYYYRVRSESGIESNEVVGKRVAKTVEPRFQFTLTGTDWPSTRGINNEADVLVAGRPLKCRITLAEPVPNCAIKLVNLIGNPVGGTPATKQHKISCLVNVPLFGVSTDGGWVNGRVTVNNGSTFEFEATLKTGAGYHGEYNWKVYCEYEINGKPDHADVSGPNKNVYFERDGVVKGTPNWFTYWEKDGACPGLNNSIVHHKKMSDSGYTDGANVFIGGDRNSRYYTPDEILKVQQMIFRNAPTSFFGIYDVEAAVAHELQHIKTQERYDSQIKQGKRDQDSSEYECAIQTGYGLCVFYKEENRIVKCDHIVDDDEEKGFEIVVGKKKVTIPENFLNKKKVDTYGIRSVSREGWWEYGGYGDDEILSRIAECIGFDNAEPQNDWAYPGELAGGIPPEASPSYRGTRTLSATPKSSPRLLSLEPQSNTNLIITINGISIDAHRDQNSVTGIVYTIGVSIQGDELVNFNGYLVDAQSNVVAIAVSAANEETESVELFFDSRNIFDNYNGGPLTLGSVDLTVDGSYSTNNVIGTLYDFAVEPVEICKSELLCNKGYILDGATTNDVSASGIVVSIPVFVNVADDYRLETELVNTNDELVAMAFATNYCATGTNVFELTFTSDAIYQNGRSGINAVKNVQLWCGDEMIDANATALELTENRDIADFVPSGVSVAVDSSSGRFLEPDATPDGKLSSVRFVFDVTNATETMVGYDVASVLMNTNSEIVASIRTAVAVTNGLNQVEITIPASTIAKSGVNGPYRFESIELLPQGEGSCGTTYRPSVLSAAYMASDFGASAIEPCGMPWLIDTTDRDRLTVEYSYEALRVGRVVEELILADRNGDFAARVVTTNDVSEIGVKTNSISIVVDDVAGGVTNGPYAVACLSLTPDIIGEDSVYMDTEGLTNIFWTVAAPVFSPVTKTVFFRRDQPIVISCATDGAEIRYTLDGSEPTDYSLLYNVAFTISSNTTVKAKAFVDGMRPSETVQAEYIHAAIVGDNLAQCTSPEVGVAQTVSVPVPGTYQVSFDWTQGGAFGLRLSRGGDIQMIAEISAESAGSTNILFEISASGDYELTVCDLTSGESQPAELSNLSIAIPDTPENKGRFWVYETEDTYCSTGEWSAEEGFKNGIMSVEDSSVFTPYTSPDGRFVTITTTMKLKEWFLDDDGDEITDCKLALRIGMDEDDEKVFQLLAGDGRGKKWTNVYALGCGTPTTDIAYTFKVVLDCSDKTYSVSLVDGDKETPLGDGQTNVFSFASSDAVAIEQIGISGRGDVGSLLGEYRNSVSAFSLGDILQLANGAASVSITAAQAAWLNAMNAYDSVKAKLAGMSGEDLMVAYLLNLDLTKDGFGLVSFCVSGIEITETEVRINVNLSRHGAVQVQGLSGMRDAPINGILKLYGGETPQAKSLLNATVVTGESFDEGGTATFVYPRSGNAKFFRPVIDVP